MVTHPSYQANSAGEYSPPPDPDARCEVCGAKSGRLGVHNRHGHWFSLLAVMEVAGGFGFDEHGEPYRTHFGDALPEQTELVAGRCQWCRKAGA